MGATTTNSGRIKADTPLALKAITAAAQGKTVAIGDGLTGKVHAAADGTVSIHVSWRYRIGGKTREVRIGTWRDKGTMSLKALRDKRDAMAADLRNGIDPIERGRADRLKAAADVEQAQAAERQRLRELADAERTAGEAAAALSRRMTVRDLFSQWQRAELAPQVQADGLRTGRKDGGEWVLQSFERRVFPRLGSLAAEDVRRADLLAIIDDAKASGKLRTAQVLLTDLSQMFRFAAEREIVPRNPMDGVKRAKVSGRMVERERVLSEDELRSLTPALLQARLSPRSAAAVWVILATGVRVGECMGALWADLLPDDARARQARISALQALCHSKAVDAAKKSLVRAAESGDAAKVGTAQRWLTTVENHGDPNAVKVGVVDIVAKTWSIPDTKNQRAHTVHLSEFALAQFAKLAELREALRNPDDDSPSPWVFPATENQYPVCVKSLGKQFADRQREPAARLSNRSKATQALTLPGGRWTAHDLRRTAATVMARLGVSTDVIDECLNHKLQSKVARVYIQDRREADQQRAFDLLGRRLAELGESPCASPSSAAVSQPEAASLAV